MKWIVGEHGETDIPVTFLSGRPLLASIISCGVETGLALAFGVPVPVALLIGFVGSMGVNLSRQSVKS